MPSTTFGRIFLGGAITAALGAAAFALAVTSMLVALLGGTPLQGAFEPSPTAVADIPARILPIYLQAAQSRGIEWAILAAIGKIETDHGRSTAPGVRSGVNAYGCCAGPMQFSITQNANTWRAYGVDGDRDGDKDVYDPVDAIPAAADYLKASGAPQDNHRAIFAYNHAEWYVAEVLTKASEYRGAPEATRGRDIPASLTSNLAGATQVLRLADGPRPRIKLAASHRNDLSSGAIDSRVTSLLVAIARTHTITVWSLKSDHGYLTASGNPSNHAFGRAVDIGVVDGEQCASIRYGRTGRCWDLARQIAQIKGALHPTELIFGIDPDGPTGPALAMSDHTDHIHAGWHGG